MNIANIYCQTKKLKLFQTHATYEARIQYYMIPVLKSHYIHNYMLTSFTCPQRSASVEFNSREGRVNLKYGLKFL